MKEKMLNLNEFIDALAPESKVHICIHDLAGITETELLQVIPARRIHSSSFCTMAKSYPGGLSLCLENKTFSNRKAENEKEPFVRMCPFGAASVVYPVVYCEKTVCIIYASLLTKSLSETKKSIEKTAEMLGCDLCYLKKKAELIQETDSFEKYLKLLEAIASYICLLLNKTGFDGLYDKYSGCVRYCIETIASEFDDDITVENCASNLGMNKKYLGRIFKKETGKNFKEFLNCVRLKKACSLLGTGSASIMEVSVLSGFNSVTYFNRIFKEKMNMTPVEYRNMKINEQS